jgi:flagellar motor switch protein FliN
MNSGENQTGAKLDARPDTKQILDQWVESLAQVLESMTEQRPQTAWQAVSGTVSEVAAEAGPENEILWWEQPFHLGSDAAAWVGAPRAVWEHAGTLTLKAAGLESVEASEARNTWSEILSQSLGAMARSIGSVVGHEVNCEAGLERAPGAAVREWARVSLRFAQGPPGLLLAAFSSSLIAQFSRPAASPAGEAGAATPQAADSGAVPARSRTMELLLDVDLPVSISFGKAELPMRDVLKLTTGSIVELNRSISEPVEVLVNHCLIARGEVVVVDGNYGVRIQEIVSRQDRLRSIR